MRRAKELLEEATQFFQKTYRADPEWVSIAPCRINLIGEHTDYTGGFCLPFAGDRYLAVAARRTARKQLELASLGEKSFSLSLTHLDRKLDHWADYVRGLLLSLPFPLESGFQAAVISQIPIGAGLSSSAALNVAFLNLVLALTGQRITWKKKTRICQKAEELGKGVRCGVLDIVGLLKAKASRALLLDCQTMDFEYIPLKLPRKLVFLIVETGITRSLASSAYNKRRKEAFLAAKLISPEDPDRAYRQGRGIIEKNRQKLGAQLFKRAYHIASENLRVKQCAQALEREDFESLGRLLSESHASLSRYFEVSLPSIDALVRKLIAHPAVLGARLMGAGFGGSLIALVQKESIPQIKADLLPWAKAKKLCLSFFEVSPSRSAWVKCVQ